MALDLIGAMQAEYARSKRWGNVSTWLAVLASVVAIVTLLLRADVWTMALGSLALVFPVASFVAREIHAIFHARAEQIRRILLLADGLGKQPSPVTLANLQVEAGNARVTEPPYLPPYYNSSLPPGPSRLADIAEESAFFTHHLAAGFAKILFRSLLIIGTSLFLILWLALQLESPVQVRSIIAKTVAGVVLLGTTGGFLRLFLRFQSLSRSTKPLIDELEGLRLAASPSLADVLRAVGEYNCSVLTAPPIPRWVYSRMRDQLNAAWREHRSG